jgi:hypothetical protein
MARRHWYQFSIAFLMCAMVVVGLALTSVISSAERQRAAAQRIIDLGGTVRYREVPSTDFWPVRQLCRALPQHLSRTVVEVDLNNHAAVTDANLSELHYLSDLEILWLSHTGLTDEGLRRLRRLRHLKLLYIYGTDVSDEGVAEIRRDLPECEIIH